MAEPLVPDAGTEREPRWVGRHLLRAEGARWQGVQLDSHEHRRGVRSSFPLLRPRRTAVRQDVAVAGYRGAEVSATKFGASSAQPLDEEAVANEPKEGVQRARVANPPRRRRLASAG